MVKKPPAKPVPPAIKTIRWNIRKAASLVVTADILPADSTQAS
jgi:hypothetical protein